MKALLINPETELIVGSYPIHDKGSAKKIAARVEDYKVTSAATPDVYIIDKHRFWKLEKNEEIPYPEKRKWD